MSNLTNPLSGSAQFYAKKSDDSLKLAGKQLASGYKGPSAAIVDYVVGSSLETRASVLTGVSKSVIYASNLCNVGLTALNSAKDIVTSLRSLIAIAGNSTGAVLAELNSLYQEQIVNLNRILSTTAFDGRTLFDGSLASINGIPATALMPALGQPLAIRLGESITNTTTIDLPRLLSGNGTVADVRQGDFTPVIPITQQAVNDKSAAVAQLAALVAAFAPTGSPVNAVARTSVLPVGAVPVGATAAVSIIVNNAIRSQTVIPGLPNDELGSYKQLCATLQTALNAAQPYINPDEYDAFTTLIGVVSAMPLIASTSAQCLAAVKAIPIPGTTLGDAVITLAQGVPLAPNPWGSQGRAILVATVTQALIGANQVNSAFSLTADTIHGFTQEQQLASSDTLMINAYNNITGQIAAIGSKSEVLATAADDIGILISVDQELAADYLSTNYEKAAADFKEYLFRIQGALAEITQGFELPKAVLQLMKQ